MSCQAWLAYLCTFEYRYPDSDVGGVLSGVAGNTAGASSAEPAEGEEEEMQDVVANLVEQRDSVRALNPKP